MKRPAIVRIRSSTILLLLWSNGTFAQVPTAAFEDDEEVASPSALPRSANQQHATAPEPGAPALHSAGEPASDSSTHGFVPVPAGETQPAGAARPAQSSSGPAGMAALEERTSRMSTALRPGFARLNLYVSEPGSTVFVTQRRKELDEAQFDSALARCSAKCAVELPLGSYTVWVKTSEEARSSRDFELRSSRWMSVAPANQVMRDFGFVAGTAGAAATIVGIAILSELVCQTCTSTGRNITGGLAFGLGLPMGAVGWSLYFIHREARIADQVLAQAERAGTVLDGAVVQTRFAF